MKTFKTIGLAIAASALLAGCSTVDRLANVGEAPRQSNIENPTTKAGYKPASMPMPVAEYEAKQPNSLWAGGSRKTFFKDQRAKDIGDILTVLIEIDDEANLKNETSRDRTASEEAGVPNALGYENYLQKAFPSGVDPANLLSIDSASNTEGTGEIKRNEEVNLKVAAVVSQVQGRQEVRVNFENRVLEISGIIRPEDITIENTIGYEKVAEARIAYGGRGQITDVQQPRLGQQVIDILSPF